VPTETPRAYMGLL